MAQKQRQSEEERLREALKKLRSYRKRYGRKLPRGSRVVVEGDVVHVKEAFHYSELISDAANAIAAFARDPESAAYGFCYALAWLNIEDGDKCVEDLLGLVRELKQEGFTPPKQRFPPAEYEVSA